MGSGVLVLKVLENIKTDWIDGWIGCLVYIRCRSSEQRPYINSYRHHFDEFTLSSLPPSLLCPWVRFPSMFLTVHSSDSLIWMWIPRVGNIFRSLCKGNRSSKSLQIYSPIHHFWGIHESFQVHSSSLHVDMNSNLHHLVSSSFPYPMFPLYTYLLTSYCPSGLVSASSWTHAC